jgi:AP-4 complex subunit epsilon-1
MRIAIVHECFQGLISADVDIVIEVQSAAKTTFVAGIRHLLLSQSPNDIYLFVTCLGYLDAALWSGSKPELPAVLEAWEVERVIALLDFPDISTRKKVHSPLSNSLALIHSLFSRL